MFKQAACGMCCVQHHFCPTSVMRVSACFKSSKHVMRSSLVHCLLPGQHATSFAHVFPPVQEATELSQLFQGIESAFASGDLQKIADMLATMRRSLKLVGSVPEFSGGKEKLQVHCLAALQSLHTMPLIADALTMH